MNLEELKEIRKDLPPLGFNTRHPRSLETKKELNKRKNDLFEASLVEQYTKDFDYED